MLGSPDAGWAEKAKITASHATTGNQSARMRNLGTGHAPLAFVDRATAVLRTGNPQLDRTTLLFSDADAGGRFGYLQTGLRQFRRVD